MESANPANEEVPFRRQAEMSPRFHQFALALKPLRVDPIMNGYDPPHGQMGPPDPFPFCGLADGDRAVQAVIASAFKHPVAEAAALLLEIVRRANVERPQDA